MTQSAAPRLKRHAPPRPFCLDLQQLLRQAADGWWRHQQDLKVQEQISVQVLRQAGEPPLEHDQDQGQGQGQQQKLQPPRHPKWKLRPLSNRERHQPVIRTRPFATWSAAVDA